MPRPVPVLNMAGGVKWLRGWSWVVVELNYSTFYQYKGFSGYRGYRGAAATWRRRHVPPPRDAAATL